MVGGQLMRTWTSVAPASRTMRTILRLVGPRKIDVLENAVLVRLGQREADRLEPGPRDAHHLARLDLAHVLGAQQIERAGLRSQQPRAPQATQVERAETARVADGVELVASEQQQGVGAFHLVQRVANPP